MYSLTKYYIMEKIKKARAAFICIAVQIKNKRKISLGAGPPLSNARERRRAKRSVGKESGEEMPRK